MKPTVTRPRIPVLLTTRVVWLGAWLSAAMLSSAVLSSVVAAELYLVEQGQPRAEIILPDQPTRTQRLAAEELQTYIEKISGARLAILQKVGDAPVHIYIGESPHTERLGIRATGLKDGAYRIASGDDWLVFVGDDRDFTPIEPWPRNNADLASGKMQAAWDQITGHSWGYMHSQLYKHYSGPASLFGTPSERKTDQAGRVHVWNYDERGSFNAVCGFLYDLGVRWYMPGEIGEVVPRLDSIRVPAGDVTVRPDFSLRTLNFRPGVYGRDVAMWGFRLGTRESYGRQAAHGLDGMTDNEPTLKQHPDWFALYGGQRQNDPKIANNQLCYSNEELFRQAVEFARVQLDHFNMDVVSIMPPDGYTAICQCEQCEGKESPELGPRGMLSNYVWDFVNRVAKEVGKTHPGKKISNCAYGIYTEPPSNIEKLEPNVQVILVGGRQPLSADRDASRRLRAAWEKKTDNPIEIFENYPFTGRGWYLPAYVPRILGDSINETKGHSQGEDIWLTMDFGEDAVGYNHFLIYVTARMYWGGQAADPVKLFDEYVEKFYGPVAPQMRLFFAYCEQHWREMEKDQEKTNQALALFAAAQSAVSRDSIYGKRIQLIDNFLNGLRNKARQLAQRRGPVPALRLVSGAEQRGRIVVDGVLDDEPWQKIPLASTGRLFELQTGRLPTYGTSFMAEWIGNDLYFAIRCEEQPGEPLNIATKKAEDQAIWYGDLIEIELATEAHSYYQLAINPAGALVDLDRGAPRDQWFTWSSQAEVATKISDDHWTVEVRIPVTEDTNDPLHQVVGHLPTTSLPWFINICRQRIRSAAEEYSAFSPSGTSGFHEPLKFAHFHAGNSFTFPADPTVTDHLLGTRAADRLMLMRKWDEALAIWLQLAAADGVTAYQKSDAMRQAASCAVNLKDYARAEELVKQIPIEAVAETTRMQNLAAQQRWSELVTGYGDRSLKDWPFWQIAAGAFIRGQAFYFTKNGPRAEADLALALQYERDPRLVVTIRSLLAQNREDHLHDDSGALELYRQNFMAKKAIGGADEFRSVDRAAAILTKQGRLDDALLLFSVVDYDKQTGYWLHEMLISKGKTLAAAGRKMEALALYRRVIEDGTASATHRKRAAAAAEELK